MSYYVGYDFALAALRAMRCGLCVGPQLGLPVSLPASTPKGRLPRVLDTAGNDALARLAARGPLEVLVRDPDDRIGSSRVRNHVIGGPLPSDSFLWLSEDLCITAPELLFTQMAARLEPNEALVLGMELCGTFSHGPLGRNDVCMYGLKPVMSSKSLGDFLEQRARVIGSHRARLLLPFLLEHAASPVEAALAALMRLPARRGGYGLGTPELNKHIELHVDGVTKSYFLDVYLPRYQADFEYESDEFHHSLPTPQLAADKLAMDKRRLRIIQSAGIRVIPVVRQDIRTFDDLESLMRSSILTLCSSRQTAARMIGRLDDADATMRRHEAYDILLPWHS